MGALDLTGNRFGHLTVIARAGTDKFRKAAWMCACECGNTKVIVGQSLVSGASQSCGCKKHGRPIGHGHATRLRGRSNTYSSWRAMRYRCLDPQNNAYRYYGGRGISVCERWDSFDNFLSDMGERPAGHVLSRIDHAKGYSPENVVWGDAAENTREAVARREAAK